MAEKYKLAQYVPYWKDQPAAVEWMQHARADNEFQTVLPCIPDAVEGVNALNAVVPVVAYITARPQSVVSGTKRWLAAHGFPDAPVLAKPDAVDFADANSWKGRALGELHPHVLGIIDDNPSVLGSLPQRYPGSFFLFGHARTAQTPAAGAAAPDWHRTDLGELHVVPSWREAADIVRSSAVPSKLRGL